MANANTKSLSLVKILNASSCLMILTLAFNIHSIAAQLTHDKAPHKEVNKAQKEDASKITDMSYTTRLQGWNLINGVSEDPQTDKDGNVSLEDDDMDPRVKFAETSLHKDIENHTKTIQSHAQAIAQQQKDLKDEQKKLNDELRALIKNNSDLSNQQEKRKEDIEAGINRMAHVYEQMPPKDAAAMFNVLDMRVMVPVAQHMIPRKVSDIMGNMDPDRANTLSQYLAGLRQLSNDALLKLNSKTDYPINNGN